MIDNFLNKVICGDSKKILMTIPSKSVNLIVTSPPYFGCRVYGNETEGLGREAHPLTYIDNLYDIIKEANRVLRDDGSIYIVMGDVYFGSKGFSRNKGTWARKTDGHYKEHKIVKPDGRYIQEKQLLFLPERLAIKMQESGQWLLRADIIWEKYNPIPSHSPDRVLPVHEHILFFSKNKNYYFDYETIKKFQRHRSVIRNGTEKYDEHQATFPESLVEPYIISTSKEGDVVMDMFGGSGTVGAICARNKRKYILIDVVEDYCKIAENRIKNALDNPQKSSVDVVNVNEVKTDSTLFDVLDEETVEETSDTKSADSDNCKEQLEKPEKKTRVYVKHPGVPHEMECCICKNKKKTNFVQFTKCLNKSGKTKEDFVSSYKCRECRNVNVEVVS